MKRRSEAVAHLPEVPPQPPPPRPAAFAPTPGVTQWQHCGMTLGGAVEACPKCNARPGEPPPPSAQAAPTPIQTTPVTPPAVRAVPEATEAPQTPGHSTPVQTKVSVAGGKVRVEATVGEQLFAPVQYFSFRVGPFHASVEFDHADPSIDPADVVRRLGDSLRTVQRREFEQQLDAHLEMVQLAQRATTAKGLGR